MHFFHFFRCLKSYLLLYFLAFNLKFSMFSIHSMIKFAKAQCHVVVFVNVVRSPSFLFLLLCLSSLHHFCPAARQGSRPGTTARLLVKCWRLVPLGPWSHSWHPAARLGGPVPRCCHSHTKQSSRRHHIMSVFLLRNPSAPSIVWKPKNKQVNTTGGERWAKSMAVGGSVSGPSICLQASL